MIIFNKKRIIFINLSIILAIFIYSLDSSKQCSTQTVSSTPVSNIGKFQLYSNFNSFR